MKEKLHFTQKQNSELPAKALCAFVPEHGLTVYPYGYYQFDLVKKAHVVFFKTGGTYTSNQLKATINPDWFQDYIRDIIRQTIINPVQRELERRCLLPQTNTIFPKDANSLEDCYRLAELLGKPRPYQ